MNYHQQRNRRKRQRESNSVSGIEDLLPARDAYFRREYIRENQDKEVQTFSRQSLSDNNDDFRYCVECNSRLIYFENSDLFRCSHCGLEIRNNANSDIPNSDLLLTKPGQKLTIPGSHNKNQESDKVFFSWTPDSLENEDNKNYEVLAQRGNWKHIRMKSGFSAADYDIRSDSP